MKRLILVAALLLAACSATTVTDAQKSLITACNGYAVSLSTLADFRSQGKLSAGTIAVVDQVVSVTSPLCDATKPLPTDVGSALDTVSGSAQQLVNIIAGVKS